MRQRGWHPVLAAAAQAVVAVLCLVAGRSARAVGDSRPVWRVAAAMLLLLAMNSLCAFDLVFIELMRGIARTAGWYESRRGLQIAALVALGAAGVAAWSLWRQRPAPLALAVGAAPAARWGLAGLAVLATLTVLRVVSLHGADDILNARLAGLTVGRLINALGLTLVATGAWQEIRTPRP